MRRIVQCVMWFAMVAAMACGQVRSGTNVIPCTSSLTLNPSYLAEYLDLTCAVTAVSIPSGYGGQPYRLIVKQDGGSLSGMPGNVIGDSTLSAVFTRFEMKYDPLTSVWSSLNVGKVVPTTVTQLTDANNYATNQSVASAVGVETNRAQQAESNISSNAMTSARAAQAAPVQSVNGMTGDVMITLTKGDTGATGPAGAASTVPGPAGVAGQNGQQGIQGIAGTNGQNGAAGANGAQGPIGLTGATGAASTVAGPQGIQGLNGNTGSTGLTGNTGPQGIQGATGAASTVAGPQGIQGVAGVAATVSVGTVTTLGSGATPTVTNAGTSSAAVLNFGLPAAYLKGTSGVITGTLLALGGQDTGTVAITGVAVGTPCTASPTDGIVPGAVNIQAWGTATNTATVFLTALVAGTPASKTYYVRCQP